VQGASWPWQRRRGAVGDGGGGDRSGRELIVVVGARGEGRGLAGPPQVTQGRPGVPHRRPGRPGVGQRWGRRSWAAVRGEGGGRGRHGLAAGGRRGRGKRKKERKEKGRKEK
jgi:hypothetical protein